MPTEPKPLFRPDALRPNLAAFQLPAETSLRLSVAGPSTLRKIRPLPLEVYTPAPSSATR